MKLRRIAFLLVPAFALALALAPLARAEDGEGQSQDLKKRIQQKMEKILELMKKNEEALLKLSTGQKGKPQRVDIDPPEQPQGSEGTSGGDASGGTAGGAGGTAGSEGEDAVRKLEEIVRAQGGAIPDELKQLVEMIPL